MARASLLGVVVLVATAASADPVARQPAFDEAELVSGAALALAQAGAANCAAARPTTRSQLDSDMRAFFAPFAAIRDPRHSLLEISRSVGRARNVLARVRGGHAHRRARRSTIGRATVCRSRCCSSGSRARRAHRDLSRASRCRRPGRTTVKVVIASHVNAVVRTGFGEETVVDFNIRAARGATKRSRRVSDSYALGLVLYELGRRSAAARRACREPRLPARGRAGAPEHRGLWVNLGSRCTRAIILYEHAEAAYLRALEIDEDERSALAQPRDRLRSARQAGARGGISRTRARLSRAQSVLPLRGGDTRLRAAAVLDSARGAAQGGAAQARRARVLHAARSSVDGHGQGPRAPSRASSVRASIEAIEYARTRVARAPRRVRRTLEPFLSLGI